MNYYIDFDNTLYNTPLLTQKMLDSIAETAYEQKKLDKKTLLEECKLMFNREHIYNIYELAQYFADKYNLNLYEITTNINKVILNSSELVFADSIEFLIKLKNKGHSIFLLSYCKESLQYQSTKISGSQLGDFFDALFITSTPKYELDIDYTNGIFIDDNPTDLLGLYSKNPKEVIRLRRKCNKYSLKDLENVNIKEYCDFTQVPIL